MSFLRWTPRLVGSIPRLYPQLSRTSEKSPGLPPFFSVTNLPTYYINLDRREDRRVWVEKELETIGIVEGTRFPAIANALGILGCTRSHIRVLELIEKSGSSLSMICEDDIEFLAEADAINAVVGEFAEHPGLDVLCLAYRLRAPRLKISKTLAVGNSIQTASCYVVTQKAVGVILESFRQSERMLEQGVDPLIAANDMHWKIAQTNRLFFAFPRRRLARQRPSFSDIAGRFKNYGA